MVEGLSVQGGGWSGWAASDGGFAGADASRADVVSIERGGQVVGDSIVRAVGHRRRCRELTALLRDFEARTQPMVWHERAWWWVVVVGHYAVRVVVFLWRGPVV